MIAKDTVCSGKKSSPGKPDPRLSRECGYLCRDKGQYIGFKSSYGDCQCMEKAVSLDDCKVNLKDMNLYKYKGTFVGNLLD